MGYPRFTSRWIYALAAAILVAFAASALASGTPAYLIPAALVVVLVVGYGALQHALAHRHQRAHGGSSLAAMRNDEDWAIPSAHLVADDATDLGDTTEVHSELSPHDLPIDHPGRGAAEAQVARTGTPETSGNADGSPEGDYEGRFDKTQQRTGEPHRNARAKSTRP